MPVAHRIQDLLARVEREHEVRILYACESGSRAWGFASPDSDYDIRFLFVRPGIEYLSVAAKPGAIEPAFQDGLDPSGWDVRKAAGLLGKSNGPLLEWLNSPAVYWEEPGFLPHWRTVAIEVLSPKLLAHHYRGLARQVSQGKLQDRCIRAKDYLYALRALLAARWVAAEGTPPPVPFAELMPLAPITLAGLIGDLLEHKWTSPEKERIPREPALDAFVDQSLGELEDIVNGMPDPHLDPGALDKLFRHEVRRSASTLLLTDGGPPPRLSEFTLERIRRSDMLLFETIAGSRAYGTAVAGSDEDRRGVFVAPPMFLAGLDRIEQIDDERGDQVFYELGRFVELLLKNNPNALELLAMPDDCVVRRHPLFDRLTPELFLSKLCARTFGEYAMGQIRKARGLNKKIVNPEPEQRRPLLDFCHVADGQGSVPVLEWLDARHLRAEQCGLTAVRHMPQFFAVYYDPDGTGGLRGLVSRKNPHALVYSSVPLEARPIAWLHCNLDAFKAHCRAHREYWTWVGERNEERFTANWRHARGYDSKNLLHTLRLLDMAGEIATQGLLQVRRPNYAFLLRVRVGEFAYDELVARADSQRAQLVESFAHSGLPEEPDRDRVNRVLIEIRREFQGLG